MSDLPYLYGALAVLLAGLALVVVQSRRPLRFRAAGLAAAIAAFAATWAGLSDALGRAKPTAWEFGAGAADRYEVLFADVRPGAPIHLLLRVPGLDEPRLYVMPWRPEVATELREGLKQAATEQLVLNADSDLFESDIEDRERLFHGTPIAALPRKDQRRFEPERFDPDEDNTMYGAGEPDG